LKHRIISTADRRVDQSDRSEKAGQVCRMDVIGVSVFWRCVGRWHRICSYCYAYGITDQHRDRSVQD
jgi:hypothetical protein